MKKTQIKETFGPTISTKIDSEKEKIKFFNSNFNLLGIDNRSTIHEKGEWHETVHLYIFSEEYILLQKRSGFKKDFPGLYDISVAGHIIFNEDTYQSLEREISEELGLPIKEIIRSLKYIGIIKDEINDKYLDKEFANVYFAEIVNNRIKDITFDKDEIDKYVFVKTNDFVNMFERKTPVNVYNLERNSSEISISIENFLPHEKKYMQKIINEIKSKRI
ncbi:MAG: NUDIX hydrolase [Mycoplasmatales bacterium]